MLKKMISVTGVALMVLASTTSTVLAATEVSSFSDVESWNPNFQAIDTLRAEGVVVGYGDGNYGYERDISRAEFLKILMEVAEIEKAGSDCFDDVTDQWHAPYICKASEMNLVEGYSDGTFKPDQAINFAEASKIVSNTLELGGDEMDGAEWYQGFVKALESKEAIPADIDKFWDNVDRGQMAEMVWRIDEGVTYKVSNDYETIKAGKAKKEVGGNLMTFDTCEEFEKYTELNFDSGDNYMLRNGATDSIPVPVMAESDEKTSSAPQENSAAPADSDLGGGADGEADDYSGTNVQVEGVDEADIVKNDGRYIYIVKGDEIRIVDAYPGENMKELDDVQFGDPDFYPTNMFVDGEKMIVFGSSYGSFAEPFMGIQPATDETSSKMIAPAYSSKTKVYIFDISNREDVKLWRELAFEGDYNTARKVGDSLYFVLNKWEYFGYYYGEPRAAADSIPSFYDSATGDVKDIVGCGDIKYWPGVTNPNGQLIIAGIDLSEKDSEVDMEYVLGNADNVYSSKDNLYVVSSKYSWAWDYSGAESATIIHKFALDGGEVEYQVAGEVPGTTLNQFSMDEYEGNLRIATTVGQVWNENDPSSNNVYVLNDELNMIGKIENIAPGERIYSTRFMGDRGYMVTFKNTDPFFVLDLSDAEDPSILGELKIPGYSDYLHPYKDGYVIGFGKDAVDPSAYDEWMSGSNFAWYQGMKIAMFDVRDVKNPKLLHNMVIGDRGTSSELLYNHKALLFDAEKGLMAFPISVSEIPEDIKNDAETPRDAYGKTTFVGAYVMSVDEEDGFEVEAKLTHLPEGTFDGEDDYGYYAYDYESTINRILYIGEYLYTVSNEYVQANNLGDFDLVKKLQLD
jgi:inhibitor of cysteine peptidase